MRFILLGTVNNRLMPLVTCDTLPSNASVKHNVLLLSSTESNFLLEIPQNETSFFPASNTHVSIVCYRSFLASYLKYVRVISWYFGHSSFQHIPTVASDGLCCWHGAPIRRWMIMTWCAGTLPLCWLKSFLVGPAASRCMRQCWGRELKIEQNTTSKSQNSKRLQQLPLLNKQVF